MKLGVLTLMLALGLCVQTSFSMVVISRSTKTCDEEPFSKREEKAAVIVTGYVDKIVREPKKPVYKCEIKVVRVFKGASTLHNIISPVMQDNKIMVGGFGDPKICSNAAHEGDTKILMMSVDEGGHLMLNSSLLTITYNSLEVVEAVVMDLPVITKPPVEKGACDRILCTFGAYCMDEEGKAKCVCPDSCAAVSAPVCGSDRVTYQSECHMKVASCEAKQLVTVLNQGECVDPCEEMVCATMYHEICVSDGATARCECPTACTQEYQPVCGSNGKDHPNECELQLASCHDKRNYTVVYEGMCDPCSEVEHEDGTVCRLDENRNPILECTDVCTEEYSPVCGSDGVMYSNTCQMEHAGCIQNREIVEVPAEGCAEDGPCSQEPCEFGQCQLASDLEVTCICPEECEEVYKPVCANDGVTYQNLCEMERTACISEMALVVLTEGACAKDLDVCSKMKCDYGATCSDKSGMAECICDMECPEEMDPVCGSDKVTYGSPCEVKRAICLQQTEIEIVSMGECEGCEEDTCPFGSCQMTPEGPECVCGDFCAENYSPVCGSDGVTYPNTCYLRRASCRMSKEITVVSEGNCDLCVDVNCTFGAYCHNGKCKCKGVCPYIWDPVCATNGVTYESECKMNLTMCRKKMQLEIDFYGECEDEVSGSASGEEPDDEVTTQFEMTTVSKCDNTTCSFGGVCVMDGAGMKCSCNMSCPAMRYAVCGSDEATYGNECQLKEASCEQQAPIVIESHGTCEDVEQEPCDGETPLSDPESGEEFNCTVENGGDECPSGSYCHIHHMGNFAVCCPVGEATTVPSVRCEETEFGCCSDGETPAQGENLEGCEGEDKECDCNEIGAYSRQCDENGQCSCLPGVIGELCNSCSPGFWNFRGILEGNEGCQPCGCNKAGSRRDDCGQDFGQCVCKEGVTGIKCDKCPAGQKMGTMGCEEDADSEPLTCAERTCEFGAECKDMHNTSICICPSDCPGAVEKVCGSDGQTYSNECQLKVIGCRMEKVLYVESTGPCQTTIPTPETPMPACEMSEFGCCPDGETEAMGENMEGCEDMTTPSGMDATQAPDNITMSLMGCASSPCKRGGTCMDMDKEPGFTCHCPLGTGGPVCMDTVHFSTPSFSGDSYIAYERIRGFLSVSIMLEFQTDSSNGLLFYSGQEEDGSGDFIALALIDNHVELRFDVGSRDIVTVRSNVEIEKFQWYRVDASRMKRKGVISVEGEPKVTNSSSSRSSGLHLGTSTYIGGVAEAHDRVYSRTGAMGGFMGCIRFLEVNNEPYNLKHPQDMGDMLYGANIGECGQDPCVNHNCRNNATCVPENSQKYTCECVGGFMGPECGDVVEDQCEGNMCHSGSTCVPEPEGSYRCDCPPGVVGDRCELPMEHEVTKSYPAFGGHSYLELPGMKMGSQHSIEIEFLSEEENGMIFYQGQKTDGNGDFVSLNLVDGFLEYRYDLGSGPAELRSLEKVNMNEWLTVVVERDGRDGSLEIVGVELIEGTSKDMYTNETEFDEEGDMSQLNLNQNFFVGGVSDFSELSRKAAITDGLVGAVRRVLINGEEYINLMEDALYQVNINEYIPGPCKAHPCLPGLLCDVEDGSCVCPEDLIQVGDRCISGDMTTGMAITSVPIEKQTEMMTHVRMGATMMEEDKDIITDEVMVTKMMEEEETEPMGPMMMSSPPSQRMTDEMDMEMVTEKMEDMATVMDEGIMEGLDTTTMKAARMTSAMHMVSEVQEQDRISSPGMMTPKGMVSKGMTPKMVEDTESLTDGMDMMSTMGGDLGTEVMGPSKLMTTLMKMTPEMEKLETDAMTGMMDTSSMKDMEGTSMVSEKSKDTSSPSQGHMTPSEAAGGMVTPTVGKTMTPKAAMSAVKGSFPPPPPMTTTAPPRMGGSTTMMPPKVTTEGSAVSTTTEAINVNAPVSFTGTEQFTYNNMVTRQNRAQFTNAFKVSIRTDEEQGLIMWNGPVDFIGLAVVDGYVTFAYQLGSGTLQMKSTVYVADGVYHTIRATRYTREGTLQVDDEDPVLAVSKPGASQLNTDGVLYIGGAPNVPADKLPDGFETNFIGCIGYLEIEEQPCNLYFDVTGTAPASFCSSHSGR